MSFRVAQKKIAVVGGGLAGLTAAYRLKQAGHSVVVFESSPAPGGVIVTSQDRGYLREHAANSFLGGPPQGALALCKELGVAVQRASPLAKKRSIYVDGKLHTLPRNPLEFARTKLLTASGKRDFLREPLVPARNISKDGDQSVYEFATRRFGPEAARSIIAPFVTGVYAADAREVSLQAGFPRLAALDQKGGIVEGLLRGAVTDVGNRLAHALGMMDDVTVTSRTDKGLWAPVGGVGRLIDALRQKLGDSLQLAHAVEQLNTADNGLVVRSAGQSRWFDGAVLAVAAKQAATLTAGIADVPSRLQDFSRTPAAMVYLGFPESALTDVCRDGFGFLVAMGERLRVLGVVFESVVWPGRSPTGYALFRCIFGGGRDPGACDLSDEQLINTAQRDLQWALGLTSSACYSSVVRWQFGIPRIPVGHRKNVQSAIAAARKHRIALAGADYRAVAVNDICADSFEIAQEAAAW
jgi:protoporphyrinogen/coproporphyrinogen III oxidase